MIHEDNAILTAKESNGTSVRTFHVTGIGEFWRTEELFGDKFELPKWEDTDAQTQQSYLKEATQIHPLYLSWFKKIVEGIKELTKEERDAVYDNLSTDATCGDERQAYCQAQLQDCKEQILEKLK